MIADGAEFGAEKNALASVHSLMPSLEGKKKPIHWQVPSRDKLGKACSVLHCSYSAYADIAIDKLDVRREVLCVQDLFLAQ